jgi:hypothetical protein
MGVAGGRALVECSLSMHEVGGSMPSVSIPFVCVSKNYQVTVGGS